MYPIKTITKIIPKGFLWCFKTLGLLWEMPLHILRWINNATYSKWNLCAMSLALWKCSLFKDSYKIYQISLLLETLPKYIRIRKTLKQISKCYLFALMSLWYLLIFALPTFFSLPYFTLTLFLYINKILYKSFILIFRIIYSIEMAFNKDLGSSLGNPWKRVKTIKIKHK